MFLFKLLAIITFLLFVGLLVLRFIYKRVPYQGTNVQDSYTPNPLILQMTEYKMIITWFVLFLGFVLMNGSIYYAERGTYYEIIYPNGSKDVEFNEGYHFILPATRINSWTANIDVKAGIVDKMSDDVEGKMNPVEVTFVDQVGADVSSSFRFTLPKDKDKFLELAVKYRSISNLVENTLIPTIAEQAKLTSKMFSAQDYISGSSQEFRQTFEEQLKTGTYIVKKLTIRDTIWNRNTETVQVGRDRKIKDIVLTHIVQKELDPVTGFPKRIQNEISASGIIVSQVIVESVDVDSAYKKRLVAQKNESATRQLEQQKIETAKISQLRIKAEGERDKEQERVTQERVQVKTLISIETKLKQEKTNLELATLQLETEKKLAETVKINADALAYKNAKLVSAGLTPQEKAEYELKEKIAIAEATSRMTTPEIVIITGGKSSGGDLTNSLIQAEMAKKLLNKKEE